MRLDVVIYYTAMRRLFRRSREESPAPNGSSLDESWNNYQTALGQATWELGKQLHTQVDAESIRPADRVAAKLIPQAAAALAIEQAVSELSQTDIINRALTVYGYFEAMRRDGHSWYMKDAVSGSMQLFAAESVAQPPQNLTPPNPPQFE